MISAFQVVDRAKEQYIGQLELLAAVMAYTTFPDLLSGQYVIHWIDNESAVYSLVKGYCGAADSARLVNVFHTTTGLVPLKSPVGLGVFSHASFAIQPRPRLRTLLDGAGPQAHGVALL